MRRHANRVLPVHELIVVQAGMLPIAEEDRRFEVRRDQWVLLRAGRRHFGSDDLNRETWFYWVCFGDSADADLGAAKILERKAGTVARPGRVRAYFEHLLEDQARAIVSPEIASSHLQLLLAEMRPLAVAKARDGAALGLPGRASAFVAEHLSDPNLSTARIASELTCSPDYLGRVFRAAFDETLTEHIHRLRTERALALFRSTELPVDRVAAAVGFSDVRYFRRIFKRRVGLTSGQFRRLRATSRCR
jgi:AraC-like DNA-binding protein